VPKYGFTLLCEIHGPNELLEQAKKAEDAGFDFVVISDHYHPWLPEHGHSPFAWSVLGAVAAQTTSIELATLVTGRFVRYHPAVIAQAAATIGVMSGGRFTLGLGAGERLNEHVVGGGWPSVVERHEMLVESAEAIRELWSGELTTYRGNYVEVEQAKIFDVPAQPPDMYIAVSGEESVATALEIGEGTASARSSRRPSSSSSSRRAAATRTARGDRSRCRGTGHATTHSSSRGNGSASGSPAGA
jgi:G6PDH family F420-dependent oxidoreductase